MGKENRRSTFGDLIRGSQKSQPVKFKRDWTQKAQQDSKNRFGEMAEPVKQAFRADYQKALEHEGIDRPRAWQIVQYLVTEADSDKARELIEKSDVPDIKKPMLYKILGIDVEGETVAKAHFENTEGL